MFQYKFELVLLVYRSYPLRLVVIKANGLIKRTFFKSPDPFVVVTVDGEQTQTSPVSRSSTEPYWGAIFPL